MRHITWKELASFIREMPVEKQLESVKTMVYGDDEHFDMLQYAIDFIVPEDGQVVYLECETNSEYQEWLEYKQKFI